MNEHNNSVVMLTEAERARFTADAVEMWRYIDELNVWLQSPEGRIWGEQQVAEMQRRIDELSEWLETPEAKEKYTPLIKDLIADAERFAADARAGKAPLSPSDNVTP